MDPPRGSTGALSSAQVYFDNVDEDDVLSLQGGRTLMVHDLRNKFTIEDVLGIFDELGAEHVDYVFLPLSVCWVANKKLKIPNFNFKFPRARNIEIIRYYRQTLQGSSSAVSKQASKYVQSLTGKDTEPNFPSKYSLE